MGKFFMQIIGLALVIFYGLPYLVEGITVNGGRAAVIAAITFAFINFAIKPILKIITIPFNILSFGLFGLLVNVLLFWFVASIIPGFNVITLSAAFWGAIIMTFATWLLDKLF